MDTTETLRVRVRSITFEADRICVFELRPLAPSLELPAFTAGSHIDLQLVNGVTRSYSLLGDQDDRHRYLIGVNNDPKSRGGSRHLHEKVRAGDCLTISRPRNNFALDESAEHSVLIAGGIGITPLWSMIQRLEKIGRSWELHYASRTNQTAAFLERLHRLNDPAAPKLNLAFDAEPGGVMLDLNRIVAAAPPGSHFYCCGPLSMLAAFEAAASDRPRATVHVEYFAAREKPDTEGGFEVELARSGKTVMVPHGKSILDALIDQGMNVAHSCREGVCGSCEVNVLDGTPDHRDLVLSDAERASNKTMMICCSGAKSEKLVLDL